MADTEEVIYNRQIKRAVLGALFEACDTFYIHCMPHPDLYIGKRGLIDKEKTEGLILVLGPYSTRDLELDEQFILCDMQFSGWESVTIPYECIVRMFDKSGAVIMQWSTPYAEELTLADAGKETKKSPAKSGKKSGKSAAKESGAEGSAESDETVIKVDFTRRKRKD